MAAGVVAPGTAVAGSLIKLYVRPSVAVGGCVSEDCGDGFILHEFVDDSPRRKTMRQLFWRFSFLCSPGVVSKRAGRSSFSARLFLLSARRLIVSFLPLCPGNFSLMAVSILCGGGKAPLLC